MESSLLYVRSFDIQEKLTKFVNFNSISKELIVSINETTNFKDSTGSYHSTFSIYFYYEGELKYDLSYYLSTNRIKQMENRTFPQRIIDIMIEKEVINIFYHNKGDKWGFNLDKNKALLLPVNSNFDPESDDEFYKLINKLNPYSKLTYKKIE